MMKHILAGSTAIAALAVPSAALAQNDGATAAPANNNVIIVTATRRAEDVQDIPIAVTAVSPEQLERQGVVNVQNITQVSPSFSTSNAQVASGSVVLRIRGVGTTSNNIGFESAVGIFIDGAYQSRPGIALGEFVDIERVEVLRGPQGTLFGRNTSAGALNITTRRPDVNEFGGFANATYGNYDHISLQGAVNVPLVQDALAVRLTGAYRERDGFVDVVDGTGIIGESNGADQYLVRGQIGYEGSSGLNVRIIGDYSESNAGCCTAIELLRSPVETAGLFNAVGLGPRGGQFQTETGLDALDALTSSSSFAPIANVEQWGITAEINFPLGDNAEVFYIGSYREYDSIERYDSDFTALDVFTIDRLDTQIDTMTHELRFQGELLDGRLSWLIGGYYSDEDITATADASLGADYGEFVGALLFGPTNGAFGANPLTIVSGGADPAGTFSTNQYTQNSESWSIFTHNTLEVADGLNLTIGLRYSDESKDGGFQQLAAGNGVCPGLLNNINITPGGVNFPPAPAALTPNLVVLGCFPFVAPADRPEAAFLPLPRTFATNFSDEELIYTGKISYEFDVPVTIYASFTHGYKSGGINLDSTAAIGGADPRFASEEVDAYEVGIKARALNDALTINVAGFHQEFTNFQVLEFTGAQFQTFNVPRVLSTGFEIESVIRPIDNLTVNLGLTYVNARYPSDCDNGDPAAPANVSNLCGATLTNAPDLVAIAGVTYTGEIGNNLEWFVNGQVRMESDRRTSTQPDPVGPSVTPLAFDIQDGNAKINLRAGIGDVDDLWAIEFWATNITNTITRGVTFNTTLRSGSRSAFAQEPRMYGVTLRTQF